jgi:hypothetical protein
MSPIGTSRRFAAMQNLVAIGGVADIEQAAPKLNFMSTRLARCEGITRLAIRSSSCPSLAVRVYVSIVKAPSASRTACSRVSHLVVVGLITASVGCWLVNARPGKSLHPQQRTCGDTTAMSVSCQWATSHAWFDTSVLP